MSSRIKKLFGGSSLLTLAGLAKAAWGLIILCAFVVAVAVAIVLLLKRLCDIPEPDRERQITTAPMSQGDMWSVYTNRGVPPSFNFVYGVDPFPMTYYDTHPYTNNGVVYDYFELCSVAPPAPHDVLVCMKLGEWTKLATVGEGINQSGFTNENFHVWTAGGEWNIKPTPACISNHTSMFWTARPK